MDRESNPGHNQCMMQINQWRNVIDCETISQLVMAHISTKSLMTFLWETFSAGVAAKAHKHKFVGVFIGNLTLVIFDLESYKFVH